MILAWDCPFNYDFIWALSDLYLTLSSVYFSFTSALFVSRGHVSPAEPASQYRKLGDGHTGTAHARPDERAHGRVQAENHRADRKPSEGTGKLSPIKG